MVDAHDIDALLVSALYGELTPAEEARLAAHLESHPLDRTALADLTRARSLIRDSRVLSAQLEPPQAVSALLLQEAARRAPAPRRTAVEVPGEGWFFRFVRSFASHPAMAAAAMLVLVVGVAGVMKMRDHGDFDAAPVETRDRTVAMPAAAGSASAPDVVAASAPTGGDLPRKEKLQDEKQAALDGVAAGSAAAISIGLAESGEGKANLERTQPAAHAGPGGAAKKGIAVTTPQLALKDEQADDGDSYQYKADKTSNDPSRDEGKLGKSESRGSKVRAGEDAAFGAMGGAATPPAKVTAVPPPPPAEPTPAPAPVVAKKPAAHEAEAPADKAATRSAADPALLAWAQGQLAQVVQLAQGQKCEEAARVAGIISAKAPDFYNENVATRRELKACMAYIAEEHERQVRAAQKATAVKAAESTK